MSIAVLCTCAIAPGACCATLNENNHASLSSAGVRIIGRKRYAARTCVAGHPATACCAIGRNDGRADFAVRLGAYVAWALAALAGIAAYRRRHDALVTIPMCRGLGPDLNVVHNDAYRALRPVAPDALGMAFDALWSDVWPHMGPWVFKALEGRSSFVEDPQRVSPAMPVPRHFGVRSAMPRCTMSWAVWRGSCTP